MAKKGVVWTKKKELDAISIEYERPYPLKGVDRFLSVPSTHLFSNR